MGENVQQRNGTKFLWYGRIINHVLIWGWNVILGMYWMECYSHHISRYAFMRIHINYEL